jgi:hypothetical protein
MSWLFSQALVAEYSAGTCLDGEPSAQWNVMPTPQGFWRNDKMIDSSRLSRFGPTLRLFTEDHGEAVLMSYLAAFPVRTLASPETEMESTASDQAYGNQWRASFAKYDRDSFSWKTPQYSLLEDLEPYSETWPKSGMTRNGCAFQRPTAAPTISARESGFLPTPTTIEGGTLIEAVSARTWPTPAARDYRSPNKKSYSERGGGKKGEQLPNSVGGQLNPTWVEWLMGWPIGWAALEPLAMDRYHEWLRQHSRNYQINTNL